MSWTDLVEIIAAELGDEVASQLEDKIRAELGGQRIFIKKKKIISRARIDRVAPGKPKEAAKEFGVHVTTIYRALHKPIIR